MYCLIHQLSLTLIINNMSWMPPSKPPKLDSPMSEEDIKRVQKQNLELISSFHPIPNSLIEWWVKRKNINKVK